MSSAEIKQICKIRAAYTLLLFAFHFDSKVAGKIEVVSEKKLPKKDKTVTKP
jgi:hypothetical protein